MFNKYINIIAIVIIMNIVALGTEAAYAERIYFAGYKGGFYLKSEEEGGMELRFGGSFQTDYRWYNEDERADNRFDIRRAQLIFRGQLTRWFRFGLQFEFEGNETDNLVDAYGEVVFSALNSLRFGQFKEPYSLEWQSPDTAIFFAERSMGYYLSPKRDIGVMFHGSALYDGVNYYLGLFNGDGDDGSARGSVHDDPEIALRFVVKPFNALNKEWIRTLHIGGSFTYARIDLANVDLKVKSTGMAGLERNCYVLGHDTKFGVLQDVDERIRYNAELGWTLGPCAVAAEYSRYSYRGLRPSSYPSQDADLSACYASFLWFITGEQPMIAEGAFVAPQPIYFFNPEEKTWGAFCIGLRYEHFEGDEDWIKADAAVSVRSADAVSAALTWMPFPMVRFVLDYTFTDFSDPLRVRVNPDGSIDYMDCENVVTVRFSIDF